MVFGIEEEEEEEEEEEDEEEENRLPSTTSGKRRESEASTQASELSAALERVKAGQVLGAPVLELANSLLAASSKASAVTAKYEANGHKFEESYDFLVVACRPLDLEGVLSLTTEEEAVFGSQGWFAFQTTLFEFPVASRNDDEDDLPAVRLSPYELDQTKGHAYGYRSETRKEFAGFVQGNGLETELVTIYQLVDPSLVPEEECTKEALWAKLEADMAAGRYEWFPYEWDKRILLEQENNPFHTRYFDRFDLAQLRRGDPWEIIDLQGKNATLYAHASTCFESVLHCYQYFDLVVAEKPKALPKKKDAKILVVGAGPSGLLAARKLERMGYRSVKILETLSNFKGGGDEASPPFAMLAGKTQTYVKEQEPKRIPCELGTCYMSPAYDDMVSDLADITVGNERLALDRDYNAAAPYFREISTFEQFEEDGPVMTLFRARKLKKAYLGLAKTDPYPKDFPVVLDNPNYDALRGFEATTRAPEKNSPTDDEIKNLKKTLRNFASKLAWAVINYILIHFLIMGTERPIPADRPEFLEAKRVLGRMTIHDFLTKYDLLALTGVFQYGYSVQGYGSISDASDVPAFYLLVWITPQTLIPSITNELKDLVKNLAKTNRVVDDTFKLIFGGDYQDRLLGETAIVTCWAKGWGDVWRQQKEQFENGDKVEIVYDAKITTITRA